jgi:uncharacterized protein (TIGR02466 family)
MAILELFPSYVYVGNLPRASALNRELNREIRILEKMDRDGVKWSRKNYVGGYSSYASLTQLHRTSPHFEELEKLLRSHIRKFAAKSEWDLLDRRLEMTTCWANRMGNGTHHTMHLHPLSVISGVYFVDCPPGSSVFKIEDPRMGRLMAAPPRKASAQKRNRNYIEFQPSPGQFILFESWMKHEVPPHRGIRARVSVSFNYEWI